MIDFVSSRHTDKNIMVRARKVGVAKRAELRDEYAQLKAAFNLTPALEEYLRRDGRLALGTLQTDAIGWADRNGQIRSFREATHFRSAANF